MDNKILRKLTSLTLMTIMVAGGFSFAIPGITPEASAQANANLFVSAENSLFANTFQGAQVIEVTVSDPAIIDTSEGKGEPDVTVNGKNLRMVQAVDGSWYGYFADRTFAQNADATQIGDRPSGSAGATPTSGAPGTNTALNGTGLDFGYFCDNDSTVLNNGGTIDLSETVAFAVPQAVADVSGSSGTSRTTGGVHNNTALTDTIFCHGAEIIGSPSGTSNSTNKVMNVVREPKDVNPGATNVKTGQIGIQAGLWPFIQLYDFSPEGQVNVVYNKAGGAQTVALTFDNVDDTSGIALDRVSYPQRSEVHLTLTDQALNIDPTDEALD